MYEQYAQVIYIYYTFVVHVFVLQLSGLLPHSPALYEPFEIDSGLF